MNIISIDPGLKSTGVYIKYKSEALGNEIEIFETIHGGKSKQLYKIFREITPIARLYSPAIAIVEDYPYGMENSQSILTMAEVKGVINLALAFHCIPIIKMPIQTWKSIEKIDAKKGTTNKARAEYLGEVEKKYGRYFTSTDEADAFLMYRAFDKIINGEIQTETAERIKKEYEDILKKML